MFYSVYYEFFWKDLIKNWTSLTDWKGSEVSLNSYRGAQPEKPSRSYNPHSQEGRMPGHKWPPLRDVHLPSSDNCLSTYASKVISCFYFEMEFCQLTVQRIDSPKTIYLFWMYTPLHWLFKVTYREEYHRL